MSCVFEFSIRSWSSCLRRLLSRICWEGAEKCTQIDLCFVFIKCTHNPNIVFFPLSSKIQAGNGVALAGSSQG